MKYGVFLTVLLVLGLTGCEYEVPLVEKKDIPVDEAILGLWEQVPGKDETGSPQEMLVLKYTDTEYLVHYPTGKDGMYFRAYPIKIDGKIYVQTQLIGTRDGNIEKKDRRYHVVSYKLSDGQFEMRILNADLVDKNLTDSAKLMEAFLKNKDNKDLFKEPGKFRKVSRKG